MTSNKVSLPRLQEIPRRHLHYLVIQPWNSSLAVCVLQAITVLKGVQSQALVLQVEIQHFPLEL